MKRNFNYILFSLTLIFLSLGNVSAAGTCITCGPDTLPIPEGIPNFVSKLITLVQVMVPIVLIVVGMVKYVKAVASGEDKVIKETNASFIRSIVTGIAIFLVVAIVKFAFGLLGSDGDSALGCVSCFMSGDNCYKTACLERPGNESNNDPGDSSTNDSGDSSTNDSGQSSTHTGTDGSEYGGGSKDF